MNEKKKKRYLIALDQGTTSSRAIIFDNEGNIIFVIENTSDSDFEIKKGTRFAQGVFMNYLVCDNDNSFGIIEF